MTENIVNIKGTKNGLIIYLDTQYEIEVLKKSLQETFESTKGFFEGASFFLKPRGNDFSVEEKKELETLCEKYGLIPQVNQEEKHHHQTDSDAEIKGVSSSELQMQNHLIENNIRNGQKLNFMGNVILMGDVNPGAQITATGNIIIIGSLKGIAHGGADGKKEAFILATNFNPRQIRIANIIAKNPDNNKPASSTGPEIAFLENEKIVIEEYHTSKKSLTRKSDMQESILSRL